MKAIVCELCGSNDVIKRKGVYVCQHCGTKYDPEEAKKLMVEVSGQVSIQGVAKIDDIIKNALNTYNQGNLQDAYRLFTDALNLEPNHPRATFYRGMCAAGMGTVEQERLTEGITATSQALLMAKQQDVASFLSFLTEVAYYLPKVVAVIDQLFTDYLKKLSEIKPAEYSPSDQTLLRSHKLNAMNTISAIQIAGGNFAETLDSVITGDIEYPEIACLSALALIKVSAELMTFGASFVGANRYSMQAFASVKRLDIISRLGIDESMPNAYGHANNLAKELIKNAECESESDLAKIKPWAEKFGVGELPRVNKQTSEISQKKSGGCYVATAVYGSYDCPQVWTLRRYRDYTLAETWYGRAFIHTYYAISPMLVNWLGKTEWFKNMWKPKLDRMVKRLNDEGVADTPYQDRKW